jgi:hypothetical protein
MAPDLPLDSVKPVFLLSKDLPLVGDHERATTREICFAAEKVVGHNTIDGAQQIGGPWRVYPKTRTARVQLLVSGLSLRSSHINLHDDNPFLTRGNNGQEIQTTKVIISNIPISFSNREIENTLTNLGCKPTSKLIDECDREDNGRLTRWKTGRRFMFIEMPNAALPTQVKIGMFTAKIYHREQKTANNPYCGNCLTNGHRKDECKKPVVCRNCRQPGQKVGDILCGPSSVSDRRETTLTTTTDNTSGVNNEDSESGESSHYDDDLSSSNEGESIKETEGGSIRKTDAKTRREKRKRIQKAEKQSLSSPTSEPSPERLSKLTKDHGISFDAGPQTDDNVGSPIT